MKLSHPMNKFIKLKYVKIILTVAIIIIVGHYFLMAFSIFSSSHEIPIGVREYSVKKSKIAVIVGFISLILIWLPWKKTKNNLRSII